VKVETRIKVQGKGGHLLSAAVLERLEALECPALSRGLDQAKSRGAFQLHLLCGPVEKTHVQNHRITESQNGRGWKGPLWVI